MNRFRFLLNPLFFVWRVTYLWRHLKILCKNEWILFLYHFFQAHWVVSEFQFWLKSSQIGAKSFPWGQSTKKDVHEVIWCLFFVDLSQSKKLSEITPNLVMVCILLTILFWPIVRKRYSSDWERLLKFKAEGWELANFLSSQEQFIETERSEQFLVTECFLNLFLEFSQI